MVEIPTDRRETHDWDDRGVDAVLPPAALLRRVSWGAIFAGAVIAVALTALLGLLGLGIGFDSFEVGESTLGEIPKPTAIWWTVTSIIATGLGAFVAGRLAGIPRSMTGALHGLAVWAVASLFTLWLATSAAGFALGAATNVATTTARAATSVATTAGGALIGGGQAAVSAAVPDNVSVDRERIRDEAVSIANRAGLTEQNAQQAQDAVADAARDTVRNPGDLGQNFNELIDRLFQGPNAAVTPADRERLVTVIAERLGVSREEAQQIAGRWETQANQAWQNVQGTGATTVDRVEQTATNVAGTTIDVLADLAWYMFWSSLAGLIAALVGASLAAASLVGTIRPVDRAEADRT
ncbi:MAG TPA: hypothetical protein VMK31_02040 [Sphingomicrobium sp.]|nr:hypothetical protein [Sphingomicrobium sp.]